MSTTPHLPIYMDYAATTPVDPRVVQQMVPYLYEQFGNPASRSHAFGWAAEEAVEIARERVAALIDRRYMSCMLSAPPPGELMNIWARWGPAA